MDMLPLIVLTLALGFAIGVIVGPIAYCMYWDRQWQPWRELKQKLSQKTEDLRHALDRISGRVVGLVLPVNLDTYRLALQDLREAAVAVQRLAQRQRALPVHMLGPYSAEILGHHVGECKTLIEIIDDALREAEARGTPELLDGWTGYRANLFAYALLLHLNIA